jgi:hypothetical protein
VSADVGAWEIAERVAKARDAGATIASLTVRARSAAHYVERLEWLMASVAPNVA